MDILSEIAENLQRGEATKVEKLVQMALNEGVDWQIILDKGLFESMKVVGELFRDEEVFIPEVIMAAKAMEAGQKVLEPKMVSAASSKKLGKVILGTVKGDVHNLGKRLVGIMLRGTGFEVVDLGEDVPTEKFVAIASSERAQIIGMSALLTTTMPYMRTTIEALREAGLGKQVKTIIGGACVTQQYADKIGADGYAENAGAAVDTAKRLLGLK